MSAEEQKAIEIGERFVASRFADFKKDKMRPIVRSAGNVWEFTYELPEDTIGGAPFVIIDKNTMQIIRSFRTQ